MSERRNTKKAHKGDPYLKCDMVEKRNLQIEQNDLPLSAQITSQSNPVLKKALKQAQENDLKYKHLVELAPDAIFVADAETGILLEANKKASELLGIPSNCIPGMHQSQLHPAEDREKYRTLFQEHAQKKLHHRIEEAYICNSNGDHVPVQISTAVIQGDNRKIIIGIFRDMTEQKKIIEALKTSREQLERLSEATFEGIVIHRQGKIIDVNQQYLDMFGYTRQELETIPHSQTIASESMALVREKMASGYEGIYEITGVRKNGTVFPMEVQVKNSKLGGRNVKIAAFRDLTEQKKLQQQLSDSERRYRELYRNAQVALYRTRISDGKMLDCSRVTAVLLGYADEEELINLSSVTETYVDPEQRKQMQEALRNNKHIHDFEIQLKRKDGSLIWVSVSAEIFPEQDFIEGVMLDITMTKILTKAEMIIMDLILQGKSNKEIAYMTKRSVRTIEDHRSKMMKKLGANNIVELTQIALGFFNNGNK